MKYSVWSPSHAILQLPSPVEKSSIYIHGSLVRGWEGNMQEESGNIGVEGVDGRVAKCCCFLWPEAFHFPRYFSFFLGRIYLLRCALIVLTPLQKCIRLLSLDFSRTGLCFMYECLFFCADLYFRSSISGRRCESGIDSGYQGRE